MTAVLSSPAAGRAMAVTGSAVSLALGLPASSVAASINSVNLQYAPFSISADGSTTTINTSTTTLSPGGIGGAPTAASKPKGKRSKSAVVKQLLEKEAEQARELAAAAREKEAKDAEVAALRAQLKEAKKEENDDEVAELKRQLREAKEAQAQQAAWQAQMQAWAAAQQAAPTQTQEAP
jgi:glutamine synthetase adenylyltransferase